MIREAIEDICVFLMIVLFVVIGIVAGVILCLASMVLAVICVPVAGLVEICRLITQSFKR